MTQSIYISILLSYIERKRNIQEMDYEKLSLIEDLWVEPPPPPPASKKLKLGKDLLFIRPQQPTQAWFQGPNDPFW